MAPPSGRKREPLRTLATVSNLFDRTTHRGKAQLSLLMNFAARAPSVIGILFFVPLVYRELGDADYGRLMAAISLGGLSSVLLGGGYYLGRRRVGEAMTDNRHDAEAEAFLTLMRASWLAAMIGMVAAVAYALGQSWSAVFIVVAVLQICAGLIGALDEVRTAYNELYFTATLRAVLQTLAYVIGLSVAWVARSPMLAALVMIGPSIAASLFSTGHLLLRRPYLLKGTGLSAWRALREALPIGLIDGLVMLAVNLSVVVVQEALPAQSSAWYATIVRITILLLTLAMLCALPLTSYFRGIWNQRPAAMRSRISFYWMALSFGFGVGTTLALWLANIVYLGIIMGIEAPFPSLETFAIYAGLGAVGAFKFYTAFGYIIMDTRSLNISFGLVLLASFLAALLGQLAYGTAAAVQWCALVFALGTSLAIINLYRNDQGIRESAWQERS